MGHRANGISSIQAGRKEGIGITTIFGTLVPALMVFIVAGWSGAFAQSATQAASSSPATTVETVTVTAEKREENIETVPGSIRAISGETLERMNVTSLQDIADMVPGLYYTPGDRQGNNQLSIRGLTSLSGGQPSETAVVGYYIDDTPISDSTFVPDLSTFDLQRIEVLKGPQGTLFGEGSIGGTVRLIMNSPDLSTFDAKVQGTVATVENGSPNWRLSGEVNIPLVNDVLGVRLVADQSDTGGFVDDVRRDNTATNYSNVTSLRAAAAWQATTNLRIDVTASHQDTRAGSGAFEQPGLSNDHSYDGFVPQFDHDRVDLFSLKANWDIDWADIVAVASYYDRSNNMEFEQRNFSVSLAPLLGAPTPVTFPGVADALPNGSAEIDFLPTRIWTQELRFVSKDDGPFTWIVGAYHRNRHSIADARLSIPDVAFAFGTPQLADVEQDYTYEQYALFGEASYEILPNLKLTGGVRFFDEHFTASDQFHEPKGNLISAGNPNTTLRDALFKADISYNLQPGVMVYALYSEGERPPGLNAQPFPSQGIPLSYGSDKAENYEAGFKGVFLDDRLVANLSAFQIDWSNVQVSSLKTGIITPIGVMAIPFIANAGEARSRGIEFDGTFAVTDRLEVGAALSDIDATLTKVTDPASSLADSVGSRLPNIPSLTAFEYAEYTLPLSNGEKLIFRAEDDYVGDRHAFFKNQPNIYTTPVSFYPGHPLSDDLPDYNLVNLRLSYQRENWTATAFVENAFNANTKLLLLGNYMAYYRGAPRVIGINVQATF